MTRPLIKMLARLVLMPALIASGARAETCPDATSGKNGFVVERGERSRTEVFHIGPIVRTIMRSGGNPLLETTQYEGLFDLDRIDRGRHTTFKPKSDLAKIFPLKQGRRIVATFDIEAPAEPARTRTVELRVAGHAELYIGNCKYEVLKVERSLSQAAAPPAFVDVDYYSPDLKLVLAKEYKNGSARPTLIKFDKIYLRAR